MELAIVTGAGSGLGAALSLALARRGFHVLLVGRRAALLTAVAAACGGAGSATALALDVAAPGAPAALAAAAAATGLPLRFVVHNAGTLGPIAPLASVGRAQFEETLQTNAVAPLFLTQALLPALRAGSRVLHISSGAAQRPFPSWGAYCASKAALHMLYGVLAAELGASGVAFGSVRPGVVDTPMQDRIREEGAGVPAFTDHARFVALREGMGAPSAAASAAAAAAAPPPAGALDTADNVATFLCWLLTQAGAAEFSAKEWDIRDAHHQPRWVAAPPRPPPAAAEERFDVLDAAGARTGATAPRSEVHARGLFHGAAHVWVLAPHTGEVLLQRRAASKDSWPGLLDCSAAGHISAGEAALPSALRELEEELGLRVEARRLRPLFTHLERAATLQGGRPFFNNEFQHVFLLALSREERAALAAEGAEVVEKGGEGAGAGAGGGGEGRPLRLQLQASEVAAVEWRKWRDVERRYRERCPTLVPWGEAPPLGDAAGAPTHARLGDAICDAMERAAEAEVAAALALAADWEANCDALSAALQEHLEGSMGPVMELAQEVQAMLGTAGGGGEGAAAAAAAAPR